MLDEKLLEILVCPACKDELDYQQDKDRLVCHKCKLAYPIKDDIPVMLIDEAEKLD